ncbi:MAG: aminoglycoside phosphotransferase family protein [Ruminococcus sp.]|jgi:aminoglycoside phosphotransferase (APT) family kinase protein|nr:aminoglycoside phosphotransferase family protein [Ruminococcus sp.]
MDFKLISQRKFKAVYRDGERTAKVFDESYSKADILNEALNLARVEETALNVPNLLEVCMIDGKWAIVTKFIEGVPLSELMAQNPDKIDEYLDSFVDLQMSVHAKKCPGLRKLKDKMAAKISESALDGDTKWELSMRLEGMPTKNRLCHGDFNPENIIITPDGAPFILDWAHATQGNSSADVARTYLLFCLKGNTETADKYFNLYCKKSNRDKRYVQKWLPIVAASQSVKNNPEEQEFLNKWTDVVWYE